MPGNQKRRLGRLAGGIKYICSRAGGVHVPGWSTRRVLPGPRLSLTRKAQALYCCFVREHILYTLSFSSHSAPSRSSPSSLCILQPSATSLSFPPDAATAQPLRRAFDLTRLVSHLDDPHRALEPPSDGHRGTFPAWTLSSDERTNRATRRPPCLRTLHHPPTILLDQSRIVNCRPRIHRLLLVPAPRLSPLAAVEKPASRCRMSALPTPILVSLAMVPSSTSTGSSPYHLPRRTGQLGVAHQIQRTLGD